MSTLQLPLWSRRPIHTVLLWLAAVVQRVWQPRADVPRSSIMQANADPQGDTPTKSETSAIDIPHPVSETPDTESTEPPQSDTGTATLTLTRNERDLIEQALVFKRNRMPSYLMCVQDTTSALDALIDRLRGLSFPDGSA